MKKLDCDPCSISYFSNGQFFIVAGSDKKASLYTRDGVFIGIVAERDAWLWSA